MGTTSTDEYGKVTLVAESAVITASVSDLKHGDVILVPGKGKRGVRQHSNGKLTLVFPRSGQPTVDGKSAGKLSDLGQHDPAVVGYVQGGWAGGDKPAITAAPKAKTPKAAAKASGRPAKGSAEAKARMAQVRAARGGKGNAKAAATTTAAPSDNRTHFQAALDHLALAIDNLQRVEIA